MKVRLKILLIVLGTVVALLAAVIGIFNYQLRQDQPQMFAEPIVDDTPPPITPEQCNHAVLVFSKTNGYRHKDAIDTGNQFFRRLAEKNDWPIVVSENGAVFNPGQLSCFDVIVWNNASGPALTSEQRKALKSYVESGGGFVGIHAAGDGSHSDWPWYQNQVIRASFIGHSLFPQFQTASIDFEQPKHPVLAGLPKSLSHEEEWYSFEHSPRAPGVDILITVDERSYAPRRWINGRKLSMGDDHPVAWAHQLVGGRVVYTAFGHQGKTFELPWFQQLLEQSVIWAGKTRY